MIDRRLEFKDELWRQGEFLWSVETKNWNHFQIMSSEEFEERSAFVCTFSVEEGHQRSLVFEFGSAEECREEVDFHNKNMKLISLLLPPNPKKEQQDHKRIGEFWL